VTGLLCVCLAWSVPAGPARAEEEPASYDPPLLMQLGLHFEDDFLGAYFPSIDYHDSSRLELLCLANLATVHQWAGNLKESETIGAELVRRVPENPEHHLILARTYAAGLKWEEALAQVEAARARDPERDWSEVYPFLGRIHSHLGHTEEAERCFALYLADHPSEAWALKLLGDHYFRTARFGPAVEVYLRTVEITPRDKSLHHKLSEALRRLGRTEEAEKHARIYRQLDEESQFLKPVRTGD